MGSSGLLVLMLSARRAARACRRPEQLDGLSGLQAVPDPPSPCQLLPGLQAVMPFYTIGNTIAGPFHRLFIADDAAIGSRPRDDKEGPFLIHASDACRLLVVPSRRVRLEQRVAAAACRTAPLGPR